MTCTISILLTISFFKKHLIVIGLENTGYPKAQTLAFDLARKWLNNNYEAYFESIPNAMFEKVGIFYRFLKILNKFFNTNYFGFLV